MELCDAFSLSLHVHQSLSVSHLPTMHIFDFCYWKFCKHDPSENLQQLLDVRDYRLTVNDNICSTVPEKSIRSSRVN